MFDILPLHGTIEPGDSQTLQFSFYGHENSDNAVEAVCQVEGGPKYKIQLRGQAALVQYSFDKHFINFGEVVSSELVCIPSIYLKLGIINDSENMVWQKMA